MITDGKLTDFRAMAAIFTKQLIGFLDLMGFSDALKSDDDLKMNGILALQAKMRAEVGAYFHVLMSEGPGDQRTFSSRTAISAFSDNFLVSISIAEEFHSVHNGIAQVGTTLARIANEALAQGLLVRGGICLGDLYHQNGIAFGRGLVRAAAIARNEAFYPRIVIDKSFAESLELPSVLTFKDVDGSLCFDYMSLIMNMGPVAAEHSERKLLQMRLDWPGELLARCDRHLQALPAQSEPRAFQNWNWMREDIIRATKLLENAQAQWRASLDSLNPDIQ